MDKYVLGRFVTPFTKYTPIWAYHYLGRLELVFVLSVPSFIKDGPHKNDTLD